MEDEQELIERAQGGDQAAFLALLARHDRQIMSVVYRFTSNQYDREDLYQEVFLHCYRAIGGFRFRSSLRTWLYRIALNRCLTYMRKQRPAAELREEPGTQIDWERQERLRSVHQALGRLGGRQRICFHLFYLEDWDVADIAEVLDCSQGAVKSHLNRARGRIRGDREVEAWLTT